MSEAPRLVTAASGGAGAKDEECSVCVAVKVRPLVPSELDDGCRESLFVSPGTTTQVRAQTHKMGEHDITVMAIEEWTWRLTQMQI